ncbi:MAG: hypothetical protein PUK59_00435 [Actinomycetaceae bacterium]|nr:hypothetical protein [Actinomycetaceae bacterium]MDY5854540.1 hypothetical protein [Arcanobacterium sp.]
MSRTHIRLLTLVATLLLALSGCKAGVEMAIHSEDSATLRYEIQVAHSDFEKWMKLAKGIAQSAGDIDPSAFQEPRNCADLFNANSDTRDWERYLDVQDNSTNDEIRCIISEDYNIHRAGWELERNGSDWTLSIDGGGSGSGMSLSDLYSAIFDAADLDGADALLEQKMMVTITMPAPITGVSWKDAKINGNSVTFDALHQEISDLVITAQDGARPIGRAEGIVSPAEPEGRGLSGGAMAGIIIAVVAAAVLAVVIALLVRRSRSKRHYAATQAAVPQEGYPSTPFGAAQQPYMVQTPMPGASVQPQQTVPLQQTTQPQPATAPPYMQRQNMAQPPTAQQPTATQQQNMTQPSDQPATVGQFEAQTQDSAAPGGVERQPMAMHGNTGGASPYGAAPMQRPTGDLTPEQERAWQEYYAKYAQYQRQLEEYQAHHTE